MVFYQLILTLGETPENIDLSFFPHHMKTTDFLKTVLATANSEIKFHKSYSIEKSIIYNEIR